MSLSPRNKDGHVHGLLPLSISPTLMERKCDQEFERDREKGEEDFSKYGRIQKGSVLCKGGVSIYNSLLTENEMKPTLEICACVVDMLGRSGRLDQALQFIKEMPLDPGPSIWGSLLSASIMHHNSISRDPAYRCLLELEPENPSNYILLSNTYASDRRWDVVTEVGTMMKERGLRKLPGCSWITISGTTHSFVVADKGHPSPGVIYETLDDLVSIMTGDVCADIDIMI